VSSALLTTASWLMPLAYAAGSVNFSIILFKVLGRGDPRNGFSGNPGTSNVTRQLGYVWGAIVLILDVSRAACVALLAGTCLHDHPLVAWTGFALLLGNRYPLFHGFKGGKGVATYLGFTAYIAPPFAMLSCLVWVVVYAVMRTPFIGSFFMVTVAGIGIAEHYRWGATAFSGTILTLAMILYAHLPNVRAYLAAWKGLTKKT
jgi:acyl phosphate:glycerol-3-phosphate acyltransferase